MAHNIKISQQQITRQVCFHGIYTVKTPLESLVKSKIKTGTNTVQENFEGCCIFVTC
jgi:hypothetical protein